MEYLTRQETMALWVKTGYLNPLKAEVPLAYPEQGIATEQLAYGVGWVDWGAGAAGLEAEQIIVDARDRIIYGREAAQPALDKAVRDINAMIGD
jgi:multiple sugar transport system substrate-binding protein